MSWKNLHAEVVETFAEAGHACDWDTPVWPRAWLRGPADEKDLPRVEIEAFGRATGREYVFGRCGYGRCGQEFFSLRVVKEYCGKRCKVLASRARAWKAKRTWKQHIANTRTIEIAAASRGALAEMEVEHGSV